MASNPDSRQPQWDVIVLGAGAAGLLAAARSAASGARTLLLEKNSKPGVKILMSGGTRCNLTHDGDASGIMEAFGRSGRFLRQALAHLGPRETVAMFHDLGLATKVESTGKIFPASDRAVQVRDALLTQLNSSGAELRLRAPVEDLRYSPDGFEVVGPDFVETACAVVITVGGQSWPGCGTTGDGYGWMQRLGHRIVSPRPALVPLCGGSDWTHALSGLTIDRATAGVWLPKAAASGNSARDDKPRDDKTPEPRPRRWAKRPDGQRTGGFLFTHFGFSGPAVMDVSRFVTQADSQDEVRFQVDWLPDQTTTQIAGWLDENKQQAGGKRLVGVVSQLLPRRLAEALVASVGTDDVPLAELPGSSRHQLLLALKQCPLTITGSRGFAKAEVTAGGVDLRDVDPRTMASRQVAGLFIAGEILDLDGWIGGYNFQSAFSTGHLAGSEAARWARRSSN